MRIHTRTILEIESGRILADESYEYSGPLAICTRGAGIQGRAQDSATAANNAALTNQNQASSLYSTLSPTASAMATNPQGINPADMAKIQTSNQQTAGGANSGAVGQGSLLAARTKNAGTADSAIAKSGEAASQNLSKANLSTQLENQNLKTQQQGEGIKALGSLYGTSSNAAIGNRNASNASQNLEEIADKNSIGHGWATNNTPCFLTSACTQYAGLPDDCPQLTILREFRDGYMAKLANGKGLIAEYYLVAPRIVEEIDRSDARGKVYRSIFKMVSRCIRNIRSGHKKRALEIYSKHYLALKREFSGEV